MTNAPHTSPIPDVTVDEFSGCDCEDQICSAYEAWCSEVQMAEDYNALSQAERLELATSGAARVLAKTFGGLFASPDGQPF